MAFSAGDRLGIYEITGTLGRGGMGEVYRARDSQLGRDVAIKVLTQEYAQNEGRMKRFVAEAKAASALNHPNILTVYGIGDHNHIPYIVTEFIDGSTLRQLMSSGPVPISKAFEIVMQALQGLSKAHAIGIVHRDLKPENLMITKDGFVKILDFGLAKLLKEDSATSDRPIETLGITATETGLVMGTAAYMSPEQARGQHADARSDIFSLGLIFYEMIAGKHPFWRATPIDTMSAILRDDPPPLSSIAPQVPPDLERSIHKAIHKKPEDRFPDAAALESQLRTYRNQISTLNDQPTVLYSTDDKVRSGSAIFRQSNRKVLWIATAVMILGAIAAIIYDFQLNKSTPPAGPPIVAVMAIDNKTSDADLARADIGRVLSDAFVQVLYDCKGVQVVSPFRIQSAVMALGRKFQETASDSDLARKITTQSNANTILSGTISQIGDTYVLNATLTAIPDEKLIASYQSQSAGKTRLLENLTITIAQQLKQTLSKAGNTTIEGGRMVNQVATGSMEAYSHYVKGLDLNNQGKFLQAAEEIRKALEIDPNMGVAWSELACVYSFAGEDMKAQEAQNMALKLRDHLSRKEKLWIDSISLWLDGNGPAYRVAVEKYVREFPDDRNGYFYIGLGWQWLDHNCKQAVQWYEKAYELTPDYYPITKALVDCQLELKQREQAIASLQRYQKAMPSGYGYDQAKWRLEKLVK
jgi:serine/threonine protein kinase